MSEVLAIVLIVFAVSCWLTALINMFLVVKHRQPGLPLRPSWFEGPFNYIFRPHSLTEKGLLARRRVALGIIGFVGCIVLIAILAQLGVVGSR